MLFNTEVTRMDIRHEMTEIKLKAVKVEGHIMEQDSKVL